MSVTNYKNIECKYRIDKLDNVVYLIPEQALRNIKIDNGEAYVDNIEYVPIMFHCYNISLEDTDTLDERYEFTHTLKFSVNGYVNHYDFHGRYYVIVRSVDNEYWLVNPMFPCKVTYTYTLGANESHTDFTLSTISNHPTLRIHGMNQGRPYPCKDYLLNGIDRLFLNEKRYSTHVGKDIFYTNDGFKEVVFDKKSATFTEQFDGTNVSHGIQFNIKFDDYKDSWHYNLLEFTDNLYAAVIITTKSEYVLCGFGFGLQPSYTVTSDGEMTPDHIEVKLVDMHDNGDLFTFITGGTISLNDDRLYNFTLEYDAWECVSNGYAKYLLQKEVDVLGNPTGRYKCLEGYEDEFDFLGDNLIGTFDDVVTFYQPQCKYTECTLDTSLMPQIKMNAQQCKLFTIKSDYDWTITNNASYLQISPISGNANTIYAVSLCNTRLETDASVTTSFTIDYCDTSESFEVQVQNTSTCFYGGDEFDIDSLGQYVTIPIECCTNWVEDTAAVITDIKLYEDYIKVYVPQNDTGEERTFTLDVTMCDDTHSEVIINQSNHINRWWSVPMGNEYLCSGSTKYKKEYYQISYDNGSTWEMVIPEQIRFGDLIEERSRDCQISIRWIETEETVCYEGRKYVVEKEQIKYSTTDWIDTENRRRGRVTDDSPAECSGTSYEYRWILTSATTCVGYDKYYLYIKQQRISGSSDPWEDVFPPTLSYNGDGTMTPVLAEAYSTDCGYVPPVEPIYKWVLLDDSQFICDICPYLGKWFATYLDNKTSSAECDSTSAITQYEIPSSMPRTQQDNPLVSAVIGECVTSIGYRAFSYNFGLTSCTIGSNVTSIGEYAFAECSGLTSINIPSGVTSIGVDAFVSCSGLTSIDIPSGVTTILENTFAHCSGLTSCIFGEGSQLTSIGRHAFNACRSLTSIVIPSGVTSIGQKAFENCSSLTSIVIPSGVTSIDIYAFYHCSGLTSCIFGEGSQLTSIANYVFNGCSSLRSINIPSGVTSIGEWAFGYCSSLRSIEIPKNVTIIDYSAFSDCTSLTSIDIPSGVTSIGAWAFASCSSLTSITVRTTTPPTLGANAFYMTNDCPIYVPSGSVEAYKAATNWSNYASRIQAIQ